MTARRASFRATTIYPAVNTLIAGCIAAALADSIGWPASTCGLMIALILWTVQLIAGLPTPAPARAMLPAEQTVRVNLLTEDSRQGDFIQLPINPDQLQLFAQGVAAGKGLSTREWAGTFTPERHAQLMSKLTAAGLVEWVREGDPKSGRRLTARGERVMEKLASPYPI